MKINPQYIAVLGIPLIILVLNSAVFLENNRLTETSRSNHDSLTVVIEKFKTAISKKDISSFKKLFFIEEVPFVGIMSKKTETSIKKDFPEFQGISVSNSSKFINLISISNQSQEERSYNPIINTDGNIASINFDYSFHSEEKMIQWGNEKWNLVRVENEWLITDVIYSIHFPDIEPFPF